jgi:hypothetical protein
MANDPANPNFMFGSPRSAPRPEFSDPSPLRRNAVGSISSPPKATQTSVTTGHLLNSTRRKRGGGAGQLAGPGSPEGPHLGLYGGSQDEIIDASGVMRNYDKMDASKAERMSDADPERPPVTPATDPDSPLLTRIRSKLGGLDLAAAEE